MVSRFGSREICNVVFKTTTANQNIGAKKFTKAGEPAFFIDTATASEVTQESTTVYAQGGRGYSRLIAWEGEKQMTFTVTDALLSPMGLAVLTGAGLAEGTDDEPQHIHTVLDVITDAEGKATITLDALNEELGLAATSIDVCSAASSADPVDIYATKLDSAGAAEEYIGSMFGKVTGEASTLGTNVFAVTADKPVTVTVGSTYANVTVKLDFYVCMTSDIMKITVGPNDFGGYYYVEADTLYRLEATGKDVAATITFPKVKVQSGFTLSMAPTGDPSTFDFTMDAFPAYTYFDRTKKVMCDITMVGGQDASTDEGKHEHKKSSSVGE